MKKRFAFTLAEVLITLTIIGVIAALTIPNLMKKWSDHADVVKVKEAYSILNNAIKLAISENGPMEGWEWPNPNSSYNAANAEYFGSVLAKYLKVQKYCGQNRGCFGDYGWKPDGSAYEGTAYNVYFKTITGKVYSDRGLPRDWSGKMILANGMRISPSISSPTSVDFNSTMRIDINGAKGPNKYGYDFFTFPIRSYGLDIKSTFDFSSTNSASDCNPTKNNNSVGDSCGNWIIRKGNMDYKYRDISSEW